MVKKSLGKDASNSKAIIAAKWCKKKFSDFRSDERRKVDEFNYVMHDGEGLQIKHTWEILGGWANG